MRNVLTAIALLAVAYFSWQLRGCVEPEQTPMVRVDTVKVEAEAPEPSDGTTPDTRRTYQPRTDTEDQCFPLPQDFPRTDISLTGPLPVTIEGRTVTLQRYDVEATHYTEDVFRVPRQDWRLAPFAQSTLHPSYQAASLGVELEWKRLTIAPDYTWSNLGHGPGITLRVRPVSFHW